MAVLQSLLLSGGQVLLKFALEQMGKFEWTFRFFGRLLVNWWFLLKKFPFSMAYPMISLSYVFGMLAAIFIFHESIPATRWIGVFLIMSGCVLIAR